MKIIAIIPILLTLALSVPVNSKAAIADSSAFGFTVKYDSLVAVDAGRLYDIFCKDVGQWWDPSHTWSGKSENLYIQQYVGGCFGERWENGGSTRHMNVIYTQPGQLLRMEGGIGPLQQFPVNGVLTLELKPAGGKTRITLTYAAGGYVPGGITKFSGPVNFVLGAQFNRYISFALKNK